jgi:hypothetical protein
MAAVAAAVTTAPIAADTVALIAVGSSTSPDMSTHIPLPFPQ